MYTMCGAVEVLEILGRGDAAGTERQHGEAVRVEMADFREIVLATMRGGFCSPASVSYGVSSTNTGIAL
jgi:hypothetical protein